ncbi:MAG: DNA polymerase III subunit beta [Clostridium sp.]|uniref:DNA polymerase III subunit beta n=1 Tax=Clostridium sp. TaxID=1506 RepID=UPI00304ECD08
MKIKIDVADIHQILKVSTDEKISIVAYENIVYVIGDIKSGKDDLSLDQVMCKCDYPWIEEPGKTLISRNVLKSLPTNGDLTITENTLECGKRKITYKLDNQVAEPTKYLKDIYTVNKKIFDDLIEVEYALAKDETRPILTGMFINKDECVALDGFRVSIRKSEGLTIPETLLPSKLIKSYRKVKNKAKEVTILETVDDIALKVGNIVILVAKLQGEYIKYKDIIPNEFSKKAVIDSTELLRLLKSYNDVKYVKLNFTKEELTIISKNETLTIEDKIDCKFEGEDLEIAFNCKYLIETIKHYENMIFKFNSSVSPLVITDGVNKIDMLLPVRIKKDN